MLDRKKGLGGSDIPVLLGLSKWKSPLDLYLEKTNSSFSAPRTDEGNNILNMGKELEPYVTKLYETNTLGMIENKQLVVYHSDHKFLWGTIDGMHNNFVFEAKTTNSRVSEWRTGIPDYIKAQVAYYSHLLNSDGAKVAVLFRDSGEFYIYDYERDEEKEKEIIKAALDFWERVQTGNPPEATTYKEAQMLYKEEDKDKKVVASPEDEDMVLKLMELKEEIKEKEKAVDLLKTFICHSLGDAPVLEDSLGNHLVTWKERSSSRVSAEILKKQYPETYKECLIKSSSRFFLIKGAR